MAAKRFVIDGYGQIELNKVAFRRDGRIEAQCALDSTAFASNKCENGMLLSVDRANSKITLPTTALPVALVYTTEHMYDERATALKYFATGLKDFYPRLGYLAQGDRFTTNTISYDSAVDTAWTDDSTFKTTVASNYKTTAIYGGMSSDGSILVSATKPTEGPVLKVVKSYTMPNDTYGIMFEVM